MAKTWTAAFGLAVMSVFVLVFTAASPAYARDPDSDSLRPDATWQSLITRQQLGSDVAWRHHLLQRFADTSVTRTVVSRPPAATHPRRPLLRTGFINPRGRAGPNGEPRQARGAWRTLWSTRATSNAARRRRSAQPIEPQLVAAAGAGAVVAPPWRSAATTPALSRLGPGPRTRATRLARIYEAGSSRFAGFAHVARLLPDMVRHAEFVLGALLTSSLHLLNLLFPGACFFILVSFPVLVTVTPMASTGLVISGCAVGTMWFLQRARAVRALGVGPSILHVVDNDVTVRRWHWRPWLSRAPPCPQPEWPGGE